ncbi:replication protein RepA [Fibrella forsythiae]|uniref:Plasmid encoded RepA protein n=1 Tax=Fibrella forsythiae TaxID=2817061 RepID=A0ABS3JSR6_9BACT|nr:replication protein RepA [Fibrella forsythiae]MBO0953060.1 plasmid encoded RepA protein [Fibrella forsythiae]
MTEKKQALSPVAKRRTKLVYEAFQEEPDDRDILFQSGVLCHTFFPRREPELALNEVWRTDSGKMHLYVMPMPIIDPTTNELRYLGLPYGAKARIILANLNTIALKTQNPVIEMPADNLTNFTTFMGFSEGGSQVATIRDQISRMSSCVIRMAYDTGIKQKNVNLPLVSGFDLFPEGPAGQRALWPSQIILSDHYFHNLIDHAVPLAKSHMLALSGNVTALDVYSFLAHRLHRIPRGKPQFLAWSTLYEQFGKDYARIADFRLNFGRTLKLVKSLYTDAHFEEKGGKGLLLHFSQPPVTKKLMISGLDSK